MLHHKDHQPESGQSLVEMAFGFVILLVLFAGVIDLGRMYYVNISLEDSVGEAAIFLSINPKCRTAEDGVDDECADPNNALFRARNAGTSEVDWNQVIFTIDRDEFLGGTATVTARYPFPLITPIISQLVGDNAIWLSSRASQTIIRMAG